MFADPVEKLKEVFKIMSFQENQKSGLLNGKREVKRKHQEKKEKRLNQLQEINKALSRKQDAFKEYEHQEQKYREELNRLTIGRDDQSSRRNGRGSDSYRRDPNRSSERDGFPVSKYEEQLNGSRSSSGSGCGRDAGLRSKQFLQMKTPAAWKSYQHEARGLGAPIQDEMSRMYKGVGVAVGGKRISPAVKQMVDMRSRALPKTPLPLSNMLTSNNVLMSPPFYSR